MEAIALASASRVALLEAAALAVFREVQEDGHNGVCIDMRIEAGQTVIDLTYLYDGRPVAGHSL